MNPLPNRPLLNSSTIPLALPNLPAFDQLPFNGRPRKVLPEAGKEFPLLNGIGSMSGTNSSPAIPGSSLPIMERNNPTSSSMIQQQLPLAQISQTPSLQPQASSSNPVDKDKEGEPENRQLTAIFRPDDEWKEKLRLSHENIQNALGSWDRRRDDDDDVKDEDSDVDDEDTSVTGDGEESKVWKVKRTLRK